MSVEAEQESPKAGLAVNMTFWQHPLVQDLLPLGTSVLFHLAVIVIGLLTWGTYKAVTTAVLQEQVIIPDTAIIDGAQVGGIPNPGLGGDPNMTAAQNVDPNITVADGWAEQRGTTLNTTLMQGGGDETADSVIAQGPRMGLAGTGSGGTGGDGGGPMAGFGVPGGGQGLGFPTGILGVSGNARRVVYICDCSGSMVDVVPRVKLELNTAVEKLRAMQAFNIIVFSDVEVTPLNKTSLVMATPENKRKAFEMSRDMYAAGTTDPLPAIRLAFEQKPELIYILTDGFDAVYSYEGVINEFRKLNADKKVKVNTILIRGANNAELERVVRVIASENGGVCKIIDRQDL